MHAIIAAAKAPNKRWSFLKESFFIGIPHLSSKKAVAVHLRGFLQGGGRRCLHSPIVLIVKANLNQALR
jgi:hypothetical protein